MTLKSSHLRSRPTTMLLFLLLSPRMGLGFGTVISSIGTTSSYYDCVVLNHQKRNNHRRRHCNNNAVSLALPMRAMTTTTKATTTTRTRISVTTTTILSLHGNTMSTTSKSHYSSSIRTTNLIVSRFCHGYSLIQQLRGGSLHTSNDDNNNKSASTLSTSNVEQDDDSSTTSSVSTDKSESSLAGFSLVDGLKEQQGEGEYPYAQNLSSSNNGTSINNSDYKSTQATGITTTTANATSGKPPLHAEKEQPSQFDALVEGRGVSNVDIESTSIIPQTQLVPTVEDDVVKTTQATIQKEESSLQLSQSTTTTTNKLFTWTKLDNKILAVALPCIANFAINPLIGAVDLFWVGRMGDALAVAGQSAANQVFNSAFWMVSFLPSVTATLVSKVYAADDPDAVQDTVCQSLMLATMIALPCTILLLTRPNFFLRSVLSSDAPAMAYARPYFFIRAIGFLPSLLSVTGYSAFRGALDTVTPLRISLFANVFNALLDPICMFTFGMGIKGAAAATLASELISATLYIIWMNKRKMISIKKLLKMRPSMSILKPLLKGGAALQLRNMAINITFLMVTRATQAIDSKKGIAAAAHSLALQVFQVGGIVLLALSTVAQTLIPSELVVKRDKVTNEYVSGGVYAARRTMSRLMEWGLVLGSLLGGLQILLLPLIQKVSPLKEVQQAALIPSYIASVLQMINGLVFIGEGAMVGCQNFFQLSMSTAVATMATTLALHVLPKRFGLTGVWMSFIVFNVLRLVGVYIHQTRTGPLASRNINNINNEDNDETRRQSQKEEGAVEASSSQRDGSMATT